MNKKLFEASYYIFDKKKLHPVGSVYLQIEAVDLFEAEIFAKEYQDEETVLEGVYELAPLTH